MARIRPRGSYYATSIEQRPDGQKFGRQVSRQARTLAEACKALDVADTRGYVQCWDDRTQTRTIVAERDEAGNWWARDVYRGILRAMP